MIAQAATVAAVATTTTTTATTTTTTTTTTMVGMMSKAAVASHNRVRSARCAWNPRNQGDAMPRKHH
jgi:hypothetical protein